MESLLPFERLKREIIVKKDFKTSDKFGKSPEQRTIKELLDYGIINLDKPSGPTSHQVSAYLQKILEIKKSGHSGTLDPKVTGVLPIALGRATRVVQSLLISGKEYVALMHLHKEVEEGKLRNVLKEFTGKISQLPPIKSAVKRQWRERNIYYIDIIEIDGQDVLFKIGCQAGTYIRKIIHDIGSKIGGAHMVELRRTKAGPFTEKNLVTLQELTDAYYYYKQGNEKYLRHCIQPMENAVSHLGKIWIIDTAVDSICHGAPLNIPGIAKFNSDIKEGDLVAVMSLKNELVAFGTARMDSETIKKSDKGLVLKTECVFMEPGIYPKMTK